MKKIGYSTLLILILITLFQFFAKKRNIALPFTENFVQTWQDSTISFIESECNVYLTHVKQTFCTIDGLKVFENDGYRKSLLLNIEEDPLFSETKAVHVFEKWSKGRSYRAYYWFDEGPEVYSLKYDSEIKELVQGDLLKDDYVEYFLKKSKIGNRHCDIDTTSYYLDGSSFYSIFIKRKEDWLIEVKEVYIY